MTITEQSFSFASTSALLRGIRYKGFCVTPFLLFIFISFDVWCFLLCFAVCISSIFLSSTVIIYCTEPHYCIRNARTAHTQFRNFLTLHSYSATWSINATINVLSSSHFTSSSTPSYFINGHPHPRVSHRNGIASRPNSRITLPTPTHLIYPYLRFSSHLVSRKPHPLLSYYSLPFVHPGCSNFYFIFVGCALYCCSWNFSCFWMVSSTSKKETIPTFYLAPYNPHFHSVKLAKRIWIAYLYSSFVPLCASCPSFRWYREVPNTFKHFLLQCRIYTHTHIHHHSSVSIFFSYFIYWTRGHLIVAKRKQKTLELMNAKEYIFVTFWRSIHVVNVSETVYVWSLMMEFFARNLNIPELCSIIHLE